MPIPREKIAAAVAHLNRADPVMRKLMVAAGPVTLKLDRNRFRMLAGSILSQQLSVHAARTIRRRLVELVGEDFLPASLAAVTAEQFRQCGVSNNKAIFLRDLSLAVEDGRVNLREIGRKGDEEVIAELVQVKGIGRWTAQMFLIFSLGRLDVFPIADLGVRSALKTLYKLEELPDAEAGEAIAARWRPYATIASWYCWRSLDLARQQPAQPFA
jgi:DNA-3-methyladenine glycosylase II